MKSEMVYDIVQFGLSLFTIGSDDVINCNCYNFYLFKYHVKNSILPVHNLNVSSSAFQFLAVNGFDFNKLFKQGVTYCNVDEEQRLKASLKRKDEELLMNERTSFDKLKVEHETLVIYNEYLNDSDQMEVELGPYEKSTLNLVKRTIDASDRNRRDSPETNLGLKSNGLDLQSEIYRQANSRLWMLKLSKLTKKTKNCIFDRDKIADESVGFSKIIQSIIRYRKPIVGHNVLVDIMHIINQFIAPLPTEYEDFKFITREIFPFIFDTKHMSVFLSSLNNRKVKSLGDLYSYLRETYPERVNKIKLINSNFEELDKQPNGAQDDGKLLFHHAGFDSYITGVCFQVVKSLVEKGDKQSIFDDYRFKNKFYNGYSYDVPYLSSEEDVQFDRCNVVHVKFDCAPIELERLLSSTFKTSSENYLIEFLDVD